MIRPADTPSPTNKLAEFEATLAVDSYDIIGEGPAWDETQQRVLWCDNSAGVVHEAKTKGHDAAPPKAWQETRQWTLNRPIAAVVPSNIGALSRTARTGLIVASGVEILTLSDAGDIRRFARLNADPTTVKLNDAKCDSRGRLWAGTRDTDFGVGGRAITAGRAALYRIDPDGAVHTMLTGVTLGNGMDWSPGGSVFYFIDTYRRSVDAFDFDIDRGQISARRNVVTLCGDDGLPDGMAVDADGNLWVAIPGTGQVRCYSPEGVLLARVKVPTPTVTSCAFGGADGTELFITSARVQLPKAAQSGLKQGFSLEPGDSRDLGVGALYVCQPGVTGAPAHPFAG
jgi:sugar lactone lactonase YvrE